MEEAEEAEEAEEMKEVEEEETENTSGFRVRLSLSREVVLGFLKPRISSLRLQAKLKAQGSVSASGSA